MTFAGNTAGQNISECSVGGPSDSTGGALAVYGDVMTCEINGFSIFRDNMAQIGGAIKFRTVDEVVMSDISFINNVAVSGGAVHIELGSKTESIFGTRLRYTDNWGCSGAAVCVVGMDAEQQVAVPQSAVVLDNALFENNHISSTGMGGGGLYVEQVAVDCYRCIFKDNHGANDKSNGGGVLVRPGAAVSLVDSTFEKNDAGEGGAAYIEGHLSGVNVTFLNNNAVRNGGGVRVAVAPGQHLANANSHVELDGCSVAGNKAKSGGECSWA